ncbi:hypothetical protein P4V63_16585, partial [Bacillus toyonensis]|nr:hypothetical protein [Bacillus toyonensis]
PTGSTGPAFSNVFGQFARSGPVAIPPDSILPLNFSNNDNTSGFSLAGGQVTVQNSGVYAIDARITLNNPDAGAFAIRVNGVNITPTAGSSTGGGGTASSTTLVRLNINDVVDIFRSGGIANISTSSSVDAQTFITIQLRLIKLMD